MVYADIDYAGLASCWILDRTDHAECSAGLLRPLARGLSLPEQVCTGRADVVDDSFQLSIEEAADATYLRASAPTSALGPISIDITVEKPARHESLNVVIPWSERQFQFTSKQNTRRATGPVSAGDRTWEVGQTEDFAVQDLGRGIWPYSNRWNWAAGSGRSSNGQLIGLQFGGKWTEGTGYTENALCVDGRLTKLAEELTWDYSWDEPLRPWRLRSEQVDLELTPYFDRYDNTDVKVVRWRFTSVSAHGRAPFEMPMTTCTMSMVSMASLKRHATGGERSQRAPTQRATLASNERGRP